MKAGDIFTLDAQSIQEVSTFTKVPLTDVQKKLNDGDTYSVAKSHAGSGDVVYASRWVDGKPRKGRPRRFPSATVARLLGEEVTTTVENEDATEDATLAETAEALLTSDGQDADAPW